MRTLKHFPCPPLIRTPGSTLIMVLLFTITSSVVDESDRLSLYHKRALCGNNCLLTDLFERQSNRSDPFLKQRKLNHFLVAQVRFNVFNHK